MVNKKVETTDKKQVTMPNKEEKKSVVTKASRKTTKGEADMDIDVFDTKGGKTSMQIPSEVFGVKLNKQLLAQAVRVYLANQRMGTAKTKTRGEVTGSTRKIYQQKGTGRARHGGIRAPLFVGGGVVNGPTPHDYSLSMPKKMKKQALYQALSSKKTDGSVIAIKGLDGGEGKTKAMAAILKTVGVKGNYIMVVMPAESKTDTVFRSMRNIQGVTLRSVTQLNAYEVMRSSTMLFMVDAFETIHTWVKARPLTPKRSDGEQGK